MADPRGEDNSYGGYSGSGGGGYNNKSGGSVSGQGAQFQGNGNDRTPSQLVAAQDFSPVLPTTAGGMLEMALNPFAPFTDAFVNETRYGLSDEHFKKLKTWQNADPASGGAPAGFNSMSPAEQVQLAKSEQLNDQLINAYIGGGQGNLNEAQLDSLRPEGISKDQWAGLPMEMKSSLVESNFGSSGSSFTNEDKSAMSSETERQWEGTNMASNGTFKPISFRSGTGTAVIDGDGVSTALSDDYADLPALVGEGIDLMGQASDQAQQDPDEFTYNFDPKQAGLDLFSERSALLNPVFAQQRTQNLEQMSGLGRLGLQLSGQGLGAGKDSGMMNPDTFGLGQAQAGVLAKLAAQSTDDAFGQEMQRMGLDLSQFNTNQMTQQQQYNNLMSSGEGMLSAGLQAPALEQSLLGAPFQYAGMNQSQQGLDQSYNISMAQNEIAKMLADYKISGGGAINDNGWLTGLTSLGSAYLGTQGGSNWLTTGLSDGGWFS